MSSEVVFHDNKYVLEGELSPERVALLREKGVKSALYLCKDNGTDFGFPNGTPALKEALGGGDSCVAHIPLDTSLPEYQVTSTLAFPWQKILAYRKFEEALRPLPTPAAISCKTSRRASAVYAAYKAVNHKLTKQEIHDYAVKNDLLYLKMDGGVAWVNDVVDFFDSLNPLIFRQMFEKESSTYTYLLADSVTKEAILIDPVLETVDRDFKTIADLGLTLKYCLNTHVHADHITGSGRLKQLIPGCQSVLAATNTEAKADLYLNEFEYIQFGSRKVYFVLTPGHTVGCASFVLDDLSAVFTGDAVLIRGCGRTDFQGGSAETLYHSIHDKLYAWLPNECTVYPAHDYAGRPQSSIWEEKKYNARLTKTLPEFIEIMNNLNLPKPKKIDEAVPANRVCGVF